ncbi:MAG: DUF362 domain-containing protein [Desulfobacterales bacterium]|nr:DUF362 domain-containing protein [Desulfobacterales bacterium]MCF8081320.1 DUF362 domain-containing protein [Desulfobacterales bacterium]
MSEKFPRIARVRQTIPTPRVGDVAGEVERGLSALNLKETVEAGQTVAVTAGSRGIADLPVVIRSVVDHLRTLGAEPYVAAAMGSHGGARAEGQRRVLAEIGITEKTVGAPIRSSMETEVVGKSRFGQAVHCGRDFTQADHVVVVNRVKPHTSFRGEVESGLLKMAVVGMGKAAGARLAHQMFFRHGFEPVVRDMAGILLDRCSVLAGIALVENRLEQTARIEVCEKNRFFEVDRSLLTEARKLMGRVPFSDVDLLIIDEMGKNISGSGIDSNVTGRIFNQVTPEPEIRQFKRIYVRALTAESDGNALGVGMADFVSRRLVDRIDAEKTKINCVTASVPEKGRIPISYEKDVDALKDALSCVGIEDPAAARLVWIKNTLALDKFWISEALTGDVQKTDGVSMETGLCPLPLDEDGNLPFTTFG